MESISETSTTLPAKQLHFDRRYGWVFEEWKEPSVEALTGGRGMFCILPLAKGLLKMASESINVAAVNMVKVLEQPDLLSLHSLQTSFGNQLGNFTSCVLQCDFNFFAEKENSISHPLSHFSHLEIDTSETGTDKSVGNQNKDSSEF